MDDGHSQKVKFLVKVRGACREYGIPLSRPFVSTRKVVRPKNLPCRRHGVVAGGGSARSGAVYSKALGLQADRSDDWCGAGVASSESM